MTIILYIYEGMEKALTKTKLIHDGRWCNKQKTFSSQVKQQDEKGSAAAPEVEQVVH